MNPRQGGCAESPLTERGQGRTVVSNPSAGATIRVTIESR